MSSPANIVKDEAVTVTNAGPIGMITLRGTLNDPSVQAVCHQITGAAMPETGQITTGPNGSIGWMSPDEVLLILPYDQIAAALGTIAETLKTTHHLAVNVSDARALMAVRGSCAREVIAKLAPADLDPDSFKPGTLRRTRLGQVAAAFWMTDDTTFQVVCFQSVADYAFNLLAASAKAGPVGHF